MQKKIKITRKVLLMMLLHERGDISQGRAREVLEDSNGKMDIIDYRELFNRVVKIAEYLVDREHKYRTLPRLKKEFGW